MLTDSKCRNAKANGNKLRKLPDDGGLYLWVYQDGRKYWRFRYWRNGKENALSLGVYPDISLKEARERRDVERKRLAEDQDPAREREAEKRRKRIAESNSFEAVAREWYEKQRPGWVPKHSEDVLRRLRSNLFPDLGGRPISEIDPPELLAALSKIEKRGAHDLAHRVAQVASRVFRFAIATHRCQRDPAADLRGALTPHQKRNQAAVTHDRLAELLMAIANYDQIGEPTTTLALRLLMLTFVRTRELIEATWEEVNLESGLWVIPGARMKNGLDHVVPLSRQALNLLRRLRLLGGGSRYLFPGRNRDKSISNNTLLFALYRLGYKSRMTGHGVRAVASTWLNESGFRADVIERQLAHVEVNKVRGAYNRAQYLAERKELMQAWADHQDALLTGTDAVVQSAKTNK